ncbi:right-handed parallel beta-helix repeat-containing protein [Azospirillum thermophilum]|uniref:Right-handed parallel beta-helix repeat-containing protein n=1 Tax=Azospirillum thermophilum TaxID=2202148 RepID=A0A2S2CP61_9PROT|nr:right-handed parallel beta-helix repeat-containing protein [Azospirillum thermophilum]AWK86314.1 right-handed parallel beta-helix repeat-containing protein [Azospirillum thermophilum]
MVRAYLCVLAVLLAVLVLQAPAALAAGESHVSPQGDDRWSGRLPQPNAERSDGPFATLARAVEAARRGGPKTILLRGGVHRLSAPVVLTAEDQDLRIAAYPGENPVLSGGEPVGGFTAEPGGVFSAPLPREPGLDVAVDGRRMRAAQSGAYDPADPVRSGWIVAQAVKGGDARRLRVAPGTLQPGWAAPALRVQALDRERRGDDLLGLSAIQANGVVVFDREGRQPFRDGSTLRLLGHPDFLKHPGQFAWRARDKRLLLRPEDVESFRTGGSAVVARLSPLIRVEGARWITIEGLGFSDVPHDGTAVLLTGARDVTLRGNRFSLVGTAVTLESTSDSEISRNRMEHLGTNGVELRPGSNDNRIIANSLESIGEVRLSGAGIAMAGVERTLVAHNDIRQAARNAIALKNWNNATRYQDNVIEYNRIRDTARETADAGAIELLGRSDLDTRTLIRFNDIRDTGGLATDASGAWLERYKGYGIYLDELTNGVAMEGNLLQNTGMAAVCIRGGDGNRVTNSIVVLTGPRDRFLRLEWVPRAGVAGFLRGNVAARSIVHERVPVDQIVTSLTGGELALEQILIDQRNSRAAPAPSPGEGRRRGGRTVQGATAAPNPYFIDPARDDFRLRPDSAARRIGFVDLPWDRIGPEGVR